jgi:uncharacterized Zn-binding protein involved in type VI secretion
MHFPGKRPIRHGDMTTHGGTVVVSSGTLMIGDRRVACVGATVMCPHCGPTTVVEGDPRWSLGHAQVSLHGHRTSCGASLIASLPT